MQGLLDRLPLAETNGLRTATLVEGPVEVIVLFLLRGLAKQCRGEGYAIEASGNLFRNARQLGERRKHVPERPDVFAFFACRDLARPACDHRHTDAALRQVALDAT